ncbi:hypothetical protein KEM56_004317, partial [Ascosphaera pollenicola]
MHHSLDDTADDYDPDLTSTGITRGLAGFARSGRIILLGDGTEVLTDMNEDEMFDTAGIQSSGQHPRVEDVTEDSVDPHNTDKEGKADDKKVNGNNVNAGEAREKDDDKATSSNPTETGSSSSSSSTPASTQEKAQESTSSDKKPAASASHDSEKAKERS